MSSPSPIIQKIESQFLRKESLPEFRPGDTLKVWVRIREGEKTRLQAFEGVVTRRSRGGNRENFTVRKISYGVGVERVFPVNSPNIDRIEVVARGKVHQARLYYLRDLSGKAARIKERSSDKDRDSKAGTSTGKTARRRNKKKEAAAPVTTERTAEATV
jgi:large subunit ribosomal protein L19